MCSGFRGSFQVERREFEHALALPSREHAEQIGLDAVHLAAGQERDEGRIGLGPLVVPEEKPVLPSDRLAAQLELTAVVVQRYRAPRSLIVNSPKNRGRSRSSRSKEWSDG